MTTIEEFRKELQIQIDSVTAGYTPPDLYEPIAYTMALGGKRIRPLLVALGCDIMRGKLEDALHPAVAVELFHNFTLLHDDIMDNAPIRRGKPTVFKKWDANTAILSGDTLFTLAYQQLLKSGREKLPEMVELLTKTAREVCEGQQLDMNFEKISHVPMADYLEMIRLKTAVLIGCSLKMGAITANASREDSDRLYSFGQNLGLAFQLQDDFLDTYGDSATFGKEIGGDISCNKKTFLYVLAVENADPETAKMLTQVYLDWRGDPSEKILLVKSIFEKLDIERKVRSSISDYFELAMKDLDILNVEDERKKDLRNLSYTLLDRKF